MDYDYGSTIAYQDNNVYNNGEDAGTAEQYAQQATDLAGQSQDVTPPPTEDWKALGVPLPSTLALDHPTLATMTAFVVERLEHDAARTRGPA